MKTAKVLLVLFVSAGTAVVAAACSSSSTGPVQPVGSSAPAPTTPPRATPTTPPRPSVLPFACGNITCQGVLNVCCVGTAGADAGSGVTGRSDAAPLADAADALTEAATDSGGGGFSDSSAPGDASGANDAAIASEAGDAGLDSGGGNMMSGGNAGFTYHCAAMASACPTGTMSLGCGSIRNCPSGQSCCGDYGDGGPFQAACAPPPCHTGINLCTIGSTNECPSGDVCVPSSDQSGVYGTCVMSDAGLAEGGRTVDSAAGVRDGSGG